MSHSVKHAAIPGRLYIIGFGSIGQGVLPLVLRHLDITADRITIITADARGRDEAAHYRVDFQIRPLTRDNHRDILVPLLRKGDFVLNLSVDVSSLALVELCQEAGAFYLDTCIEPWVGGYTDPGLSPSLRSNYALREAALELKTRYPGGPTAVLTHGANPGLVSHFMKQALLNIAQDNGLDVAVPTTRDGWARLAQRLDIKTVHVAERDTQVADRPRERGEFVNTWSIDGFVSEGCQPAELGWGTHERHFPADGQQHDFGSQAAIFLNRPGISTKVRTWTPMEGPFHGFLVTHNEAISIADYFTARNEDGSVAYRPTCHYAYHPCDDAITSIHEFVGKGYVQQERQRLLMTEIVDGIDELGVLLCGHEKGAYWYGSQLTVAEARELVPYNNATSLQVCATVLGGMVWALENPTQGPVEADEVSFERVMEIATPYLGPVVGVYTDWTPLDGRETLFPEDLDRGDAWQFKNVRVV
ncbi:homospermidine synthase [Nitrospirillum amazonense]|uniref:Homospermidine synthase n=1 Tax=Nitrospirillum amazonense TaxID=28077 RepID=A0A560EU33_9PROT|nr:saccharopine dehydrogenase NADP-binding domain-containing protein [Nitrospirillum amazonense]TWB12847.1 homospermidine synthase [Nitrospirillum amazonense]